MKTAIALLVSFLALACFSIAEEVKAEKPFKYSCVRFDQQGKVACEGTITAKQFQHWFKVKFANVSGVVITTPPDAAIFGVLVLTDGDEILPMPLQAWRPKYDFGSPALRGVDQFDSEYLTCRAYKIGGPPLFDVSPYWELLQGTDGKPLMKEVCSGTFTGAVQRVGLFFGKEPATREGLIEAIKTKLIEVSKEQ